MTEQELQKTEITLKLPLGAINGILTSLAAQPYAQVADLIQAIREQTIPQVPMPVAADKPEDAPAQ